jgi:hypothetical protein
LQVVALPEALRVSAEYGLTVLSTASPDAYRFALFILSEVSQHDWQELFYVDAALVGCGHVSGLLMRRGWPLALMLCADQVPILFTHSKMR